MQITCNTSIAYHILFLLFVGCLTSQQHASVSQGRICSDNFMRCHTEIEVADPTFYLTQSQYTDTGPTSPSADPITPGAWQGSQLECQFLSHWYDSTPKKSWRKRDSNSGSSALEADALPLGQLGGLSHAACHVPHCAQETTQLISLTEFKSHLVELYFVGGNYQLMKEGRKMEFPEKTCDDELQKTAHTTAQQFKPQSRLEPAL